MESYWEKVPPLRVLVTGGTGFIGLPLVATLLAHGCRVTVYTRSAAKAKSRLPKSSPERLDFIERLDGLSDQAEYDAIINLAGESLAQGRWTDQKKQRLLVSRIGTTDAIFEFVQRAKVKPKYLLNGSAVGFYGPQDERPLDENSHSCDSFSHRLCEQWEASAKQLETLGVDVCLMRFGVVLASDGGAFEQIALPYRFKTGVVFGGGEQYFSWIHRDDLIAMVGFLLTRFHGDRLTGALNVTAPEPVTYRQLADLLGGYCHAWFTVPAPAAGMKLFLGEMAEELLLSGQRVVPARLQEAGFEFTYPSLEGALPELFPNQAA